MAPPCSVAELPPAIFSCEVKIVISAIGCCGFIEEVDSDEPQPRLRGLMAPPPVLLVMAVLEGDVIDCQLQIA